MAPVGAAECCREDLEMGGAQKTPAPEPPAAAQAAMAAFDGSAGSGEAAEAGAGELRLTSSVGSELAEVLKIWDTDGDGTVNLGELQNAARQYLEHKKHVAFLKKTVVALFVVVVFLVVMSFLTAIGANEMTKEVTVEHNELTGVGSDVIIETAPAVDSLALQHAAVLDMGHLRTVDEISYSLGDSADDAHKVTETVIAVVVETDETGWPQVRFHTALGHIVTVDPVSIRVQRGEGEASTCASLAPDASEIRCDRFAVDDPGLRVAALDAKLAEYAKRHDAGRRAQGCA